MRPRVLGTRTPYQHVEIPEEVYEAREASFDDEYKAEATPEEAVVGGRYGADS